MDDAEPHIGEAHARDILGQGHLLPSFLRVPHGIPQGAGDQLDGLEMEHIRHLPGRLGDIALDGVGQGIHAGGGSEAFWHGRHHLGIDDRDDRDICLLYTSRCV